MPKEIGSGAEDGNRSAVRGDLYYWRLGATGLSFAVFGLGQLVLGILVFPLIRLLPGGRNTYQARTRTLLRHAFRLFIWFMRWVGVLSYEFRGVERLGKPGQLIVANHPSLIDIVFLLGFVPDANCVVKWELWHNIFTMFAVGGAGYVSNLPTESMIEGADAALRAGQCVLMFPEGTRTKPGQPMHFHRGCANVAVRAAAVVTPMYIRVQPATLAKGVPWYRIPVTRPRFSLQVGDDIAVAQFRRMDSVPAASRAFNSQLLAVFAGELGSDGSK
jgi:1-acyl-sn-glycerol-3-phosphate acyltransferase